MRDKDKVEKLMPVSFAKYENVDLDHLVMYAIGQMEKIGADLSFENAVVATFKLFPKKFSLPGYPEYPAAKRIHDCLFRCTYKTKQWLGGKTRQGFIVTDRSRRFIKEAETLLSVAPSQKTKAKTSSQTRRKESLFVEVEESSAYSKYMKNQGDSITEAELCYLLQGTLDSSRPVLRENLALLKKFAEELEHKNIVKFLCWSEDRFKSFLNLNNK